MSGPDLLAEALSVLDVLTLGRRWGYHNLKLGINRSPFRQDQKPSFSIFDKGRGWKDHATGEAGGVWAFAQSAHPNASKAELAQMLKEAAGIAAEGAEPGPAVAPAPRREAPESFTHSAAWSLAVKDRFEAGAAALLADRSRVERLADRRGWPVKFVEALAESGYLSAPELPWCEPEGAPGETRITRGPAFLVESLRLEGELLATAPVGYHQRYRIDARHQWVYVPYAASKARSKFQGELQRRADTIHPYPFTWGDPRARGWVVAEGQWDAATFGLAAGKNFTGRVFGLRGTHTEGLFLHLVSDALRTLRPVIWLLPDNDAPGRAWWQATETRLDHIPLAQRLLDAGASRVVVSAVAPGVGKDFNDLYRARWVTSQDLTTWAATLGVADWFFSGPVPVPAPRAPSPVSAALPAGVGVAE